MKNIKVVIEKTKDHYSAYAQNVKGVYAAGSNIEEVKESVEQAIKLLKKYNTAENIPAALKGDYQLIYQQL